MLRYAHVPIHVCVNGRHIQSLEPVPEVSRMLIADHSMVGLHVRNVFDGTLSRVQ